MSTQAASGAAVQIERRRSTRLPSRMVVIVCGDAGRFQEHTCTSSLSAHGALIPLAASVTIGQRLVLQNPENWAERYCRVIRLGLCYEGRTEVGVEFAEPLPDF
jgi:PilZ domain-containing protein